MQYTGNSEIFLDGDVCTLKRHISRVSILLRWVGSLSAILFFFLISLVSFNSKGASAIGVIAGLLSLLILANLIYGFFHSGWGLERFYSCCCVHKKSKVIKFSYDGYTFGADYKFAEIKYLLVTGTLQRYVKQYSVIAMCDNGSVDLFHFILSKGVDIEGGQKSEILEWLNPLAEWLGVEVKFQAYY